MDDVNCHSAALLSQKTEQTIPVLTNQHLSITVVTWQRKVTFHVLSKSFTLHILHSSSLFKNILSTMERSKCWMIGDFVAAAPHYSFSVFFNHQSFHWLMENSLRQICVYRLAVTTNRSRRHVCVRTPGKRILMPLNQHFVLWSCTVILLTFNQKFPFTVLPDKAWRCQSTGAKTQQWRNTNTEFT